jgi:hypothetical protein
VEVSEQFIAMAPGLRTDFFENIFDFPGKSLLPFRQDCTPGINKDHIQYSVLQR